jgi:hypothetical protein
MNEDAFLIPQTVFVGDEGRLVVPLAGSVPLNASSNVILTGPLPFNENIVVKQVEIDVRANRLLIDFMAFKPGVVEIPPIETVELPPLTVNIASILERDGYSITLSPPENPLAAPGTFALITGGTAAFIALAALVVFLVRYGPKNFKMLFEKIRVRALVYAAKRAILKTQAALTVGRIDAKDGITAVGKAFKTFLSALYRQNYDVYSAEDFLSDGSFSGDEAYRIFAACDKLRFSPARIEREAAKDIAEKTLACIEGWAA